MKVLNQMMFIVFSLLILFPLNSLQNFFQELEDDIIVKFAKHSDSLNSVSKTEEIKKDVRNHLSKLGKNFNGKVLY
jgi:hypothetical protein